MLGVLSFTVLFILTISVFFISKKFFADFFTPFSIYSGVWLFLFASYSLNWVNYIPVSFNIWLLLITSLIAFVVGSIIVLFGPKGQFTLATPQKIVPWDKIINPQIYEFWLLSFAILSFIGTYEYLRVINRVFGLNTFFVNSSLIRIGQSSERFFSEFSSSDYLLLHLNMLTTVLVVVYFNIFPFQKNKLWIGMIGLICAISTFFMVARTQFVTILIWSFFFTVYLKPVSFSSFKFITRLSILLVIFLGVFNFWAQILGKTVYVNRTILSAVNAPEFLSFLVDPYIYLTGTIPAFQIHISHVDNYFLGTYMVLPLTKIVARLAPNIEVPNEILPFYAIPFRFNVTTYLNVFYEDFGIIGLIVGPFLLGVLTNLIYYKMRKNPSIWLVYINSLIAYCLVYSVFNNRFITTYVWEFVFLGVIFCISITKKGPKK